MTMTDEQRRHENARRARIYNAKVRTERALWLSTKHPENARYVERYMNANELYQKLLAGVEVPRRTRRDGTPVASNAGRSYHTKRSDPVLESRRIYGEERVRRIFKLRQIAYNIGVDDSQYRTATTLAKAVLQALMPIQQKLGKSALLSDEGRLCVSLIHHDTEMYSVTHEKKSDVTEIEPLGYTNLDDLECPMDLDTAPE